MRLLAAFLFALLISAQPAHALTQAQRLTLTASSCDNSGRALIAAMTVRPSASRQFVICRLIKQLKLAGIWDKTDALYVLAAHDNQAARLNWKTPGSNTATAQNSPTFTADQGYTFDGSTNYLNTNFIPSTSAVAMTGTNMLIGTYERTNVSAGSSAGEINGATDVIALLPRNASNQFTGTLDAAAATLLTGVTDSRGLSVAQSDGANGLAYKNGAAGSPVALTSPVTNMPSLSLFIGGRNNAGSLGSGRAAQISLMIAGAQLTAAQHAALYSSFQTYMTALGSAV